MNPDERKELKRKITEEIQAQKVLQPKGVLNKRGLIQMVLTFVFFDGLFGYLGVHP